MSSQPDMPTVPQWTAEQFAEADADTREVARQTGLLVGLGLHPDRGQRFHPSAEQAKARQLAEMQQRQRDRMEFEQRERERAEAAEQHRIDLMTRRWTQDDVAKATPAELADAMRRGLLADLGIPAHRQRGDHRNAAPPPRSTTRPYGGAA